MRDKSLPKSRKQLIAEKQEQKINSILIAGRILIVCEGIKTEPNYFEWWKGQVEKIKQLAKSERIVSQINVKPIGDEIQIKGEGDNTKYLVEKAIKIKNKSIIDYSECWCVFDKDSFPPKDFNDGISLAEANGFKVAYTNEAFELWYILHFDNIETGVNRDEYKRMLTERLGKAYKKNDPTMYETLNNHPKASQKNAIKNAEKLLHLYNSETNYAAQNPSTTVHQLVERLNDYLGKIRCQLAPSYQLPFEFDCEN